MEGEDERPRQSLERLGRTMGEKAADKGTRRLVVEQGLWPAADNV